MDEQFFLQAILDSPNDISPRLVFADCLDERGDRRAALIRLLSTLTQSIDVPERDEAEKLLRALLESGVQPVGPLVANAFGMRFALLPPGIQPTVRHANRSFESYLSRFTQVTVPSATWAMPTFRIGLGWPALGYVVISGVCTRWV